MKNRRNLLSFLLLGAFLATAAASQSGGDVLSYEVASVKRKLLLEKTDGEERLAAGDALASGNVVRTAWMSRAEIAAPEQRALFRLGAGTRVRLAHDVPGLLLEVEKGRLRAIFDELLGTEAPERVVTTPSAILAVRGTEYGVDVDAAGDTAVVVFSGVVEVLDRERRGPAVLVEAGYWVEVRRGSGPGEPRPHAMSPRSFDRGGGPGSQGMGMGSTGAGRGTGMGSTGSMRHGGGSGRHHG